MAPAYRLYACSGCWNLCTVSVSADTVTILFTDLVGSTGLLRRALRLVVEGSDIKIAQL